MELTLVIGFLAVACALSFFNRRRRDSTRRRHQQNFREYERQRKRMVKM
jgi:hypothetical protein